MSIAKKIYLRYRSEGHLRFAVPPEFSHPQVAGQIEKGLRQAEGVYRVDLYPRQGKLSIRYTEGVTDFKAVARALLDLVAGIEIPPAPADAGDAQAPEERPAGVGDWMKAKYQEAKETVDAAGIVARNVGKAPVLSLTPEKEKFALEFLTDILVFYLIKLHWHMLMSHWIKRPWQFRYEWMATFYLIFLLVRSKKPK